MHLAGRHFFRRIRRLDRRYLRHSGNVASPGDDYRANVVIHSCPAVPTPVPQGAQPRRPPRSPQPRATSACPWRDTAARAMPPSCLPKRSNRSTTSIRPASAGAINVSVGEVICSDAVQPPRQHLAIQARLSWHGNDHELNAPAAELLVELRYSGQRVLVTRDGSTRYRTSGL